MDQKHEETLVAHFDPGFTLVFHLVVPGPPCPHLGAHTGGVGGVGGWCWECHIDGLVRSLLAPAIRSAAREAATRFLQNADARLSYQL